MLELAPKGFGFLRIPSKNFEQARDDVFVTPESIRKYNLRVGQWIHGLYQEGPRGPQLVEITAVNDMTPEEASKLPHFDELKAINPTRRISFETTPERFTTRVVDIMAPVGRGQRGLIVSPPRSGKTTLLLHMAEAIREKYDEAIHLMVLLVDERPEEVTEFRRALPGAEIYASSNDEQARNHCRIAEFAIERAKRLVEGGKDVFLLMDSITRLARAYNNTMNNRGRGTGSGGITIGALEVPRRLFAAARNTRGGGSLTIMATALIQTNSRADEAIFMEFKGTGNMELVLDRKIAENYIYPAVDIFKSGTRREELLIPDHMLHKIHLIRRGLSGHRPVEAMERLLFFLKKFPNNPQMLLEIKG
jgi:transcription termination factor Rho